MVHQSLENSCEWFGGGETRIKPRSNMFHKQVDLKADYGTNRTLHIYKVYRLADMNGKTS